MGRIVCTATCSNVCYIIHPCTTGILAGLRPTLELPKEQPEENQLKVTKCWDRWCWKIIRMSRCLEPDVRIRYDLRTHFHSRLLLKARLKSYSEQNSR